MIKLMPIISRCRFKQDLGLVFLALPIGLVVGTIDFIFGKGLLIVSTFREQHLLYLLPFLFLIGLVIVLLYETFSKEGYQGMGLIFEVGSGQKDRIPLVLIPLIMLSTWLTHLFGASAGREGVAVQIGATVSYYCRHFGRFEKVSRQLVLMGMAAGFAGLFQTPVAAVAFSLEVIFLGTICYSALIPSLFAAYISSWTSQTLGLEKFTVLINESLVITPIHFAKLICLGILFGMVGNAFAYSLNRLKIAVSKGLSNPYYRIALSSFFLSASLLICYYGRYSGLGTNLINAVFSNQPIMCHDWLLKWLFTIVTLSAGFQGGEVTPLFSIGACLGVVLAPYFGLPVLLVAALGYVAVFGSATNTFLAPIFIGIEVFGPENVLAYFIVSASAYTVSRNQSIYCHQKAISNK
ncbi:chloride channel protein [Streptococcus castoreus]|uniref:chloride channel protein n=1 Tax=Streptococcus castoreus TaxID=254786 RepID=UPI00040BDF32|nr:chloride channel protein [Streptococcus castoreus]